MTESVKLWLTVEPGVSVIDADRAVYPMTRAVRGTVAPVARPTGTTNVKVPSSAVCVPRFIPGMNTVAPPRGTPASLVTRPVTVVPLWATALDAVNASKAKTDKSSFRIPLNSPRCCAIQWRVDAS